MIIMRILSGRETVRRPVWYENLSGVVSCPENSNINADGLDSVVIGLELTVSYSMVIGYASFYVKIKHSWTVWA